MKKAFAVVLSILLALCCVSPAFAAPETSFGAYEHVFIFGVDGAGGFFDRVDTPNFDRIFENGAVTYTARAETSTISAQNWGSILCGVSHLRHLITNPVAADFPRHSTGRYPTVFTYARRAFPDAELTSFCNWGAINVGIIEDDIDVNKETLGDDNDVTNAFCDYIDAGNAPKLFYSHFDGVDYVGHELGSNSPEYIEEIRKIDGYLGRMADALERNGLLETSLLIVVTDHGHMGVGGHGGFTMRETNTTLAVAGRMVKAGKPEGEVRNRDVSAIVLHALGIERPGYMSSYVPDGVFEDVSGEKRDISRDWIDAIIAKFVWLFTLATAWI